MTARTGHEMAATQPPDAAGTPQEVSRRRVFLLTGYEPIGPDHHHHRFAREIRRFEKTWAVTATVGDLESTPSRPVASWQVTTRGPDWQVETDVRLLRWDDIIAEDVNRTLPARLIGYGRAAADLILSGTFWRYVRTYWRYTLFAAYPAVLLALFTLVSIAAGALVGWTYGLGAVVALMVFAALLVLVGRRFHLDYMLNDWIFAIDMIHQRRPTITARVEAMADEIIAGCEAGDVDEVVILAHSLGAVWMIEAVAAALARRPAWTVRPTSLSLVGLGSSILKIALHPAAAWHREAITRVADAGLTWVEYDSHVDFICFYKRNTVETLGLSTRTKPISRPIRLSRMLSPDTWGRFRGNLLRVHRQYVMGNEQRYAYDFHFLACGPCSASTIVSHGDAIPRVLGPDGSLGRGTPPDRKPAIPS